MESDFNWSTATRQVAEYRGAKYGRILPETDWMYFTTQAWAVLRIRCGNKEGPKGTWLAEG